MPNAIIIQHPPKRKTRCDYPGIPMPTLKNEIELNEVFSGSKVIAITINHKEMTSEELKRTITEYEEKFKLPTTDVLRYGCEKLINRLFEIFPKLPKGIA